MVAYKINVIDAGATGAEAVDVIAVDTFVSDVAVPIVLDVFLRSVLFDLCFLFKSVFNQESKELSSRLRWRIKGRLYSVQISKRRSLEGCCT